MSKTSRIHTLLRLLKKWLRPPRTLRITGAGWRFLGLTLIVGFAAMNTGNNLLYLVFGAMLSFITASGILSELMLRRMSLSRTFPQHLFAQQAAPLRVTVTNRKRVIASFSLLIEDFSQGRAAEPLPYILKVPANQTVTTTYPVTFARRGLHRPSKVRLSTRYPFGFFHKSVTFHETGDDLLVYPAPAKLQSLDLASLAAFAGPLDATRKKGNGADVHSVRDYVHGDPRTRIHWKSTAKQARLMTKELEDEQWKKLALVLDVSQPARALRPRFAEDVEQAISLAAAYLMACTAQNVHFQLITPEQQTRFGHSQQHLFALLRMLALLEPSNGHSRQHLAAAIRRLRRADAMKILISVNQANGFRPGTFARVIRVGAGLSGGRSADFADFRR
jgi:uncharacterized protein (DUF58 family)